MEIARINIRHNFRGHFALAAVCTVLIPVFFGTENLSAQAAAAPMELMFCLTGIILLTPVFQPEQNPQIADVVNTKYIPASWVYIIRTVYSILALLALTMLFAAYMSLHHCTVTFALLFGAFSDALFLGSLGYMSSAVTKNTAVSYMLPLIYYALNYSAGGRLGKFYLFGMMNGDYAPNLWLFLGGICFLAAGLGISAVRR